ncbi:MAG TPA: CDP-alcohol phosphatidyltransferase family protein [Polyangia bacterium]|nr:CDP-alcohol phosphatidyltransferase family protein [Polyangia bacterium]HWE29573.1 CDP-alcohol phosphatidyltransferase family protein [Polyangia bacterium]
MEAATAPAEPRRAWWRYAAPNLVTATSIVFGVLAVVMAIDGRPVAAAWWALYCTLTDRVDGALAKALKGGSAFGVQLDSLADLVSFGVAPAAVFYAYFSRQPELGWSDGAARVVLVIFCAVWTLATALRLARFNVVAAGGAATHYTGTPSTMTAGTVGALFIAALKYADPKWRGSEWIDHWRLLGGFESDSLLRFVPLLLPVGAFGMLSPLRVPRLGRTRSRVTDVLLAAGVISGYTAGLFHHLPEYLAFGGLYYLVVCVAYHLRTR